MGQQKVNIMSFTYPSPLQPGDTIGFVSLASKADSETIMPGIQLLESMGFRILLAPNIWEGHHQFAGTDLQRASGFQQMIDNPHVKAIICTRGGYGTLRTLQYIDWSTFFKKPKWIAGFSDITVLHSFLHKKSVVSIHSAMPKHFLKEENPTASFQTLIAALINEPMHYPFGPSELNRQGKASGVLTGGNLSMLYSVRGTPYDIDTRGKILFIEDLGEYLYHIDRIMMNFKVGGKLDSLAGLIVGGFTSMKDNEEPFGKNAEEIVRDAVAEFEYPVAFNFPAGHQEENYALKFGEWTDLIVEGPNSTLQTHSQKI